jgi:hypothetical protein
MTDAVLMLPPDIAILSEPNMMFVFSILDAHDVAVLCMLVFVICNELGCFDAITKLLCCHNTYDICGFFIRCTGCGCDVYVVIVP